MESNLDFIGSVQCNSKNTTIKVKGFNCWVYWYIRNYQHTLPSCRKLDYLHQYCMILVLHMRVSQYQPDLRTFPSGLHFLYTHTKLSKSWKQHYVLFPFNDNDISLYVWMYRLCYLRQPPIHCRSALPPHLRSCIISGPLSPSHLLEVMCVFSASKKPSTTHWPSLLHGWPGGQSVSTRHLSEWYRYCIVKIITGSFLLPKQPNKFYIISGI